MRRCVCHRVQRPSAATALQEIKNKSFFLTPQHRSTFTTRKNEEEFPHKSAARCLHRDMWTRLARGPVSDLVLWLRLEPGQGLFSDFCSPSNRLDLTTDAVLLTEDENTRETYDR